MLWALIMAGGQGTRLWPLSRKKLPKPLLKLVPGSSTLLEETIKRIDSLASKNHIWVIGNEEHLKGLKRFARFVPSSQIIGEPAPRNTLATVALGAWLISKRDPRALILVLPADHWIGNSAAFARTVKIAAQIAKRTSSFSIFGVKPHFPSTSYGYLRAGKKVSSSVYELKQFVEKPSGERAEAFFKTGKFFWHAGIFLAPAEVILNSVKRYLPAVSRVLSKISIRNGKIIPPKSFKALPNISFDYAVLERLKNAYLVSCNFEWCDLGTWNSFEGVWPTDAFKNSVLGSHLALDSKGNTVYSKDKIVCLYGVHNLAVIDTPDALLVSAKDSAEGVREVVGELKRKGSKYL